MYRTWLRFKRQRFYLTRYFAAHWVFLIAACALLISQNGLKLELNLTPWHLLIIPFCVFPGIMIPVLMHNCTHGNYKNKVINALLGELSAFFCLMSIGIVQINHTLHHAFADTIHDPHHPGGMSFLRFFFTGQFTGSNIIEKKFLEFHGDTFFNRQIFNLNRILHYGSYVLRTLCWYLILGPELFVTFFVPSFLVFSFGFAHVNYITHSTSKSGKVEILNKNDNAYYQFINFIGSGIYFHKNHHRDSRLKNPKFLSGEFA